MKDTMIDTKAIIGMRDEIERIQGGESPDGNLDYNSDRESLDSPEPVIITSDMFGADGPSLGASALEAVSLSRGSS
jgi:hypothetical protein